MKEPVVKCEDCGAPASAEIKTTLHTCDSFRLVTNPKKMCNSCLTELLNARASVQDSGRPVMGAEIGAI